MKIIRQQQIGLTAIIVGTIGIIAWVAHYADDGWLDGATASWAQALMTIVAVGASALVAQWPIQAELDRQRAQRDEFLGRIERALRLFNHDIEPLDVAATTQDVDAFKLAARANERMGQHIWDRYLALPIEAWPSIELYLSVRDARAATKDYFERAAGIAAYIQYPASIADLRPHRVDVREAMDEVVEEIRLLQNRR